MHVFNYTAPYVALLLSLCTTHSMIQRSAARRRWSADRSCFAAPYGAQCECPFRGLTTSWHVLYCHSRLPPVLYSVQRAANLAATGRLVELCG